MEKQLTPIEAFNDFLLWVHESGTWANLDKADRNRIITARRDRDKMRGEDKGLGTRRIESILTTYAPGLYEFKEMVIRREL